MIGVIDMMDYDISWTPEYDPALSPRALSCWVYADMYEVIHQYNADKRLVIRQQNRRMNTLGIDSCIFPPISLLKNKNTPC